MNVQVSQAHQYAMDQQTQSYCIALDTEDVFGHPIHQVKQSNVFSERGRFVCSHMTPSRLAAFLARPWGVLELELR